MNQSDFLAAALRNPVNETIADELFHLALDDAWIVSGCLVQTAWNLQTGRAVDYGINDYDVFYFDSDTSWAAEDAVIRKLQGPAGQSQSHGRSAQPGAGPSVVSAEARPALSCAAGLGRWHVDRFLTKTTQVGIRRTPDGYDIYAPNGYDIAEMIVRPNPGPNFSAAKYEAKARRWKTLWPELTVLPADAE